MTRMSRKVQLRHMLCVASCLLLAAHHIAIVSAGGAFQSGPNAGALYAAGLDYDDTSNEVFITGITYSDNTNSATDQCSCFFARLDGRYLQNQAANSARIGSGTVVEACHSINVLDQSTFLVGGNSDPGGVYGYAGVPAGFVMALTQQDFSVLWGSSLTSNETTYPIQTVADVHNEVVYVASVTSNNVDLAPNYETIVSKYPQPNWLQYRKYGSSFEMAVHKLSYVDSSPGTVWLSSFPIDLDANGRKPDVYLGGMIYKNLNDDILIVAGSTRGMGEGYGEAVGDDEDGFITVLDPMTGELVTSGQKSNERIGTANDDIIGGICDDVNDQNAFYIVGATKGQMPGTNRSSLEQSIPDESLQAFVMKVQLDTLSAIWTVQWGAIDETSGALTFAIGLECLVVDNVVYVAGTVENGATIADTLSQGASRGGDDIWVAQVDADNGYVNWIHQLGTEGDEHLARGGGLALDSDNNIIVYGDTNGSFYRARNPGETSADIFLVTMNKADGSYPELGGAQSPVAAPTGAAPTPDTSFPTSGSSDYTPSPVTGTTLSNDYGVQSGPSVGPLFAGGMVYDPNQDEVFLTGLSYDPGFESTGSISVESSCFVAAVLLDQGKVQGWQGNAIFGDPLVLETCNSLALHRYNELVIVGSANRSSDLIPTSSDAGILSGMALAINRDDLSRIDSTSLVTTQPAERFEYPISVVSDGDDVYVVALTSTDSVLSDAYSEIDPLGSSSSPLPINWIEIQKFGSSFDMTVSKLTLSETKIDGVAEGGIGFQTQWSKEFPIGVDPQTGTIPRVYIGGVIVKKDLGYLAIAGSTNGIGDGYGDAEGDDEDGYITLLDLETGELASNVARNTIREGSAEDDIVKGICHDRGDSSSFYVTGATYGRIGTPMSNREFPSGSLQAFLRKVDANSLEEIWTIQWGAIHATSDDPGAVYARDCAVSGGLVYVGGVVENNAGIVQGNDARQTNGGDDIWVGQVSSADGSVNWVHQVGSSGDDRMAPRGGLVATAAGHAIIFGDTTGSVYRTRDISEFNDLIVMTFDSVDGSHGDVFMTQVPVPSPAAAPTAFAPTPVEPQPVGLTSDSANSNSGGSQGISTGAIVGLVMLVLMLCYVTWWCCRRRRRRFNRKGIDDMTSIDFEEEAKKDGVFATSGNGSSYSDTPWSPASQRGGLGGFLYDEGPINDGPNLQACYSDLKNKGRKVI